MSASFIPDASRMRLAEGVEEAKIRMSRHSVDRFDGAISHLALHRCNQIPIAASSESRFRATEFLQRPERRGYTCSHPGQGVAETSIIMDDICPL